MIVELSQSKGNKRCYKRIAICTSVVTQIHLPLLKRGALHSEALARSHRHTQTLINNWFICQRARDMKHAGGLEDTKGAQDLLEA